MGPEILLSLVLCEGIKKGFKDVASLSNLIKEIKVRKIDVAGIGLRRRPGGYYSEDIEDFVGQLLLWEFATQRSPITLTEKGIKVLETNINDLDGEERSMAEEIIQVIDDVATQEATQAA